MSDKCRPGTMSDEERALAELQRRREDSKTVIVPRDEFDRDADHFTPITEVLERERIVLTDRERMIVTMMWRHSANMEMRARKRSDSTDSTLIARRVDDVEATLDEKFGRSRKNGDFGTLKERVDKAESRRWWAITFLAGLIVTTIGWAYSFGSRIGSLETEVETLKTRSYRARGSNSFPPDFPAAKE